MKWTLLILFLLGGSMVAMSVLAGLGGNRKDTVNAVGSTSIQPFAEMLAEEFNKRGLDMTSEGMTDPYLGHIGHVWSLFDYGKVWEGEEKIPFACPSPPAGVRALCYQFMIAGPFPRENFP